MVTNLLLLFPFSTLLDRLKDKKAPAVAAANRALDSLLLYSVPLQDALEEIKELLGSTNTDLRKNLLLLMARSLGDENVTPDLGPIMDQVVEVLFSGLEDKTPQVKKAANTAMASLVNRLPGGLDHPSVRSKAEALQEANPLGYQALVATIEGRTAPMDTATPRAPTASSAPKPATSRPTEAAAPSRKRGPPSRLMKERRPRPSEEGKGSGKRGASTSSSAPSTSAGASTGEDPSVEPGSIMDWEEAKPIIAGVGVDMSKIDSPQWNTKKVRLKSMSCA